MHWSGRVLVWLTVVGWVAAFPLVAKLINIRGEWAKRITTLKDENEKLAAEIEEKQAERELLAGRLERVQRGWVHVKEEPWIANVTLPGGGVINVTNVGQASGVGQPDPASRPEKPTVYVFRPTADGGQTFVGPFTVADLRADQMQLTPTWRLQPGEDANWGDGGTENWHIRSEIPTPNRQAFTDLHRQTNDLRERLQRARLTLQEQTEAVAAAEQQKTYRDMEIGDPAAQPPTGLVGEIQEASAARNEALAEVDRLWRELVAAEAEQQRLLKAARAAVAELPGGAPSAAD